MASKGRTHIRQDTGFLSISATSDMRPESASSESFLFSTTGKRSQTLDEKSFHRSNSLSDAKDLPSQGSFYAEHVDPPPGPMTPDIWGPDEPPHYFIPETVDPWKKCRVRVDRYDRELCRGWADDIDTLLVFAGLFSAIVTAFAVESFQWLSEDSEDMTVQLLQQISQQLSNPNFTIPGQEEEEFEPDKTIVRVNTFWFLSLSFSLVAASLGILCKQWLYEFRRDAGLSNQKTLAMRQMRMTSLQRWRVPSIIASLPLLLQFSLIFFFVGLVDLLWSMEVRVAAPTSVVISVSLLFVFATSIIPGIVEVRFPHAIPCAYKSSQAWAFYRALQWSTQEHFTAFADWNAFDYRHMARNVDDYLAGALVWIDTKFCQKKSMIKHLFHCLQDIEPEVAAMCVPDSPELERDGSIERILLEFLRCHPLDDNARNYFIENLLRDINKSASFVDVSRELLSLLREQLPHSRSSWSSFPDDLSLQIIDSLRNIVMTDRFSPTTLHSLWQINDGFIKHGSDKIRHRALLLLPELEQWLARSANQYDREARTLACVEILLSRNSTNLRPDTARAFAPFVEVLDEHLKATGIMMQEWLSSGWRELKMTIALAEQPQDARRWSIG